MSVRNGHLAIDFHFNVAVTNGRFPPLIVEMPNVKRRGAGTASFSNRISPEFSPRAGQSFRLVVLLRTRQGSEFAQILKQTGNK